MIIKWKKRPDRYLRKLAKVRARRLWFAWHPVRISDDEIAWLEYVERTKGPYGYLYDGWRYYKVERGTQ